jgi:hypothetical protein
MSFHNFDQWTDYLRVLNALGCLIGVFLMLTLPGGPSNGSYALLTLALCAYAASAAYGSIALMGTPSVVRPLLVTVSTTLFLYGAIRLRRYRARALRADRSNTDWGAR